MYPPPHHQENDFELTKAIIEIFPLATVLSGENGDIHATHIPLMWYESSGKYGKLVGHIDRNNPQVASLDQQYVQAVFHGFDTYISPIIYDSKGKLPTWNYTKVHAKGNVTVFVNPEKIQQSIIQMTERLEQKREGERFVLKPDNASMQALTKYILGFEIELTEVEGKFKLSQDKTVQDQLNVLKEMKKTHQNRGRIFFDWLENQ